MRVSLLLLFFMLLVLCDQGSARQQSPRKNHPKTDIYFDTEIDMTIAPCNGNYEFIYTARPRQSLGEIAQRGKYKLLMNASYFSGTRLLAKPSGWLFVNGKRQHRASKSRQLTHVVAFDSSDNRWEIVPVKRFHHTPDHEFEFQTGPLVLDDNEIAHDDIHRSLNGRGKYTRSLLAVSNSGRVYFITIRMPVSLTEAAERILASPMAKKHKLRVINLDGGASVSFYSKEAPQYNYNIDDRLPLLLGVR